VIKRLLLGLLALVLLLTAALLANTLRQGSRQVQVAALALMAVDKAAVAESMATAVRAKTVSGLLDPAGVALEFKALHQHLATRYPEVHKTLTREFIGEHSLLYTWTGSDANAQPIALLAHQDVVPIAPGTEALWKKPPFAGVVEDGMVWGRGTLDNKSNLITQLEALEALIKAGYKPRRTVYLFAGHDEEVGGQGAQQAAAAFKQRGIKLHLVLDEGLVITEGIFPGLKPPLALIGLAEKGFATVRLTASTKPGHSSMPPATGNSAIGMLAAAVARLDAQPMPGGVRGAAAEMFASVAPEMPFGQRLAISNLWLLRPVVENMLAKSPSTNAMLRTTTALTVMNAGNKDNVLPGQADALVNFRILPGDTVESVVAHVKKVVADDRIEVKAQGWGSEASPISSTSADAYRVIEKTIREVFPDSLVAPGLMLAASDARYFKDVADNTYRFMPIRFKPEDTTRPHGTDERISVDQLADMVRFYFRFVQQAAQ
jgi:carboxypeptidase PM20D1